MVRVGLEVSWRIVMLIPWPHGWRAGWHYILVIVIVLMICWSMGGVRPWVTIRVRSRSHGVPVITTSLTRIMLLVRLPPIGIQ